MIRVSTRVLRLRPALPAAGVSRAFAAAPPVRARAAGAAPARIGRIVASSLAAASLAAALQAPRPAECAKRKQETPEVVKRARSMACAATTGVLYKYVFARPPRRLIRLAGLEYHGQTSTSGHCAPANVLIVKDGLHKRMSRTKGGAFYNLVRKAGWDAFDGPIEVARKSAARMSVKEAALKDWSRLPRIRIHTWLNKNEKKDIAVKGTWRGEDVLNPQEQTLNTSAGGQGDEEKHLYALARAELRKEFRGASRVVREANRKAGAKTSWPSMDPSSPTSLAKLDSLRSELDLTDKELDKIVVAHPPLLSYSFDDNIKPKLDSLRSELHLTDKELSKIVVAFPPLVGYSLERRYAPRIGACKEAGIDPRWVLKTISLNDAKFHTALARQSDK